MTLEERLSNDLKDAIRGGEGTRKLAIRSAKAAITQAKVAGLEARELSEAEVLAIVGKQIKQRRDSIEEFTKGNRPDLVAQEQAEIEVLEVYLPRQLERSRNPRARRGGHRRTGRDRHEGAWPGDEAPVRRSQGDRGWRGHQSRRASLACY